MNAIWPLTLAWLDIISLLTIGVCAIVVLQRDYHGGSLLLRGAILTVAYFALAIAINRLYWMDRGQQFFFWQRAAFDAALGTLSVIRAYRPEFKIVEHHHIGRQGRKIPWA